MRVLVTNDDGYRAPGIVMLARTLQDNGHTVVIAAPCTNMSGMSAAIGSLHIDQHIEVEISNLEGVRAYGVDGPPAAIVLAAHLAAFGARPDVVVSGINAGLNTGQSIIHSGTVGAALTASSFGTRALAISVAEGDPWHFDTAALVALDWLTWLEQQPAGTVVNVNVPNRTIDEVVGTEWAHLDPQGAVQIAAAGDAAGSGGGLQVELRAMQEHPPPPGSDTAMVEAGYVTATVLQPVGEVSAAERPAIGTSPPPIGSVSIRPNDAPAEIGAADKRVAIDVPQLITQ